MRGERGLAVFFFYGHAPRGDLHSFPTRRSSDLLGITAAAHFTPLVDAADLDGAALTTRSEEHTSELQSHHDLVCRLLLEKKNRHHPAGRPTVDRDAPPRVAAPAGHRSPRVDPAP